jgi:hypothetical protein
MRIVCGIPQVYGHGIETKRYVLGSELEMTSPHALIGSNVLANSQRSFLRYST